jgi:hypothetical protein
MLLSGGWSAIGFSYWGPLSFPSMVIHSLNSWAWCMVLFSWAAKYLNRPSKRLTYFNQGVYPYYIVHMTPIIITLFYIKDLDYPWPLKFLFIVGVTFLTCFLSFEVLKRTRVTRVLFGIKPLPKEEPKEEREEPPLTPQEPTMT